MCVLSSTSTHMTDTDQGTPQRNRQRHVRRHIELPDGRVLIPRAELAADILGENERTTRRRKLPTTYIGNVAYVDRDGSLNIVAEGVERPNQPEPPMPKPRARPAPPRAARSARSARREQV
jgi:hypothetical protein